MNFKKPDGRKYQDPQSRFDNMIAEANDLRAKKPNDNKGFKNLIATKSYKITNTILNKKYKNVNTYGKGVTHEISKYVQKEIKKVDTKLLLKYLKTFGAFNK